MQLCSVHVLLLSQGQNWTAGGPLLPMCPGFCLHYTSLIFWCPLSSKYSKVLRTHIKDAAPLFLSHSTATYLLSIFSVFCTEVTHWLWRTVVGFFMMFWVNWINATIWIQVVWISFILYGCCRWMGDNKGDLFISPFAPWINNYIHWSLNNHWKSHKWPCHVTIQLTLKVGRHSADLLNLAGI